LLEDELTGRLHGEIEMMQLILSALAGAIGGASIAALGMIYSAAVGGGFWSLPNSIGGILLGPKAGDTRSLGWVTLVGMVSHIALSVLYGVAIVYLAQRDGLGYVITGISVGILIWLFNHLFVEHCFQAPRSMESSILSGWPLACMPSTAPSQAR
jgi:hypothetical protein